MFIRVVYTAKIGKDRDTREAGIFTNSRGEMNLKFDKDIDWSEPVFMILEPAEALDTYTEKDFYEDVDEMKAARMEKGKLFVSIENAADESGMILEPAEGGVGYSHEAEEGCKPSVVQKVEKTEPTHFDYRESSMTEKAWDELADKEAYEKLLRDKVELEAKRPVLNNKDRPK